MKRLLKREIGTVGTKVLNMHYCRILERGETMAAKSIPVADAKQILWIEDELRERLTKAIGHDFYPPDRIEKEAPSNYMISLLKSRQDKPEIKENIKIKFKITVTSSIGSEVAVKNVSVDSRPEADLQATKLIRDLGLKRATYKIS